MKLSLIALSVIALTGCLKTIPPAPEPPQVVVVERINTPTPPAIYVEEDSDAEPPLHTWITSEEDKVQLRKAIEEAAKGCKCAGGDPLCDCL